MEALLAVQDDLMRNHGTDEKRIWATLATSGLDLAQLESDMATANITNLIFRYLANVQTLLMR